MADARDVLWVSPRVKLMPVVHGSGDCALLVREELLSRRWGCLAVPLPPSFQEAVEDAVRGLPRVSVVVAEEPEAGGFPGGEWGERGEAEGPEPGPACSYVPVEPCQPVVAAIRGALGDRVPRAFIDLETPRFESVPWTYPDPYALKRVSPERFAAAVLTAVPPPASPLQRARADWMGEQLRRLEVDHDSVLCVCSYLDWPWIREAYREQRPAPEQASFWAPVRTFAVREATLTFLMGELPFVAALYERSRRELTPDENLSVDGVKELLLEARDRWVKADPRLRRRVSPQRLMTLLTYVRNLTLLHRRLTPDLYALVVAAKQVVGDDFAIALIEVAREYPFQGEGKEREEASFSPDGRAALPELGALEAKNRLPGQEMSWHTVELRPPRREPEQRAWRQRWDPYRSCSYEPEDARIESFRNHLVEQGKALIGADLARSEKFTTSLMDGIDIRETIRHFYSGDIYVRRIPPSRGNVEVVAILFDVPADPAVYDWRCTWYAEHGEESTLCLYATNYMQKMVGPGIGQSTYGGCFFIYPPRPIPDVWEDPRLAGYETLEERLLAGAFFHSQDRHVVVVSPCPPKGAWRRLARRYGRSLVHLPLSRFSQETVERLRQVHVLNGKEVRSYASEFIREL